MIPGRWRLGGDIVLGSPSLGASRRISPPDSGACWLRYGPPSAFPVLAGSAMPGKSGGVVAAPQCSRRDRMGLRRRLARCCHTQVWVSALCYPSGVTAGWFSGMTTRPRAVGQAGPRWLPAARHRAGSDAVHTRGGSHRQTKRRPGPAPCALGRRPSPGAGRV
jgi:hypothetical protein